MELSRASLAYLVFLGLVALLRLAELAYARHNARGNVAIEREPRFKWMVIVHASTYILLPLELILRRPPIGGWLTWIAVAIVLLAFVLRAWTLISLGRSWNVRIQRGTALTIVDSGPYAYIRHPNYVVVFLEVMAIPLIHHLILSAIILTVGNLLVLRGRIEQEEAALMEHPDWVSRMAGKPRFFPRLLKGGHRV